MTTNTKVRSRFTRGPYNPGMNPFAPLPSVRFPGDSKIGDARVPYEFNVKIYRIEANASVEDLVIERDDHLAVFREAMCKKYPWLGSMYFSGRSGGWLTIEDPQGKMTRPRLLAISDAVDVALARFRQHLIKEYPR
jgi:hypothetical protein